MPERRLIDDCFLTDKERLRHDEALAILRARVGRVVGVEEIALDHAVGRIVAEGVASPRPVPAADNAAVDGYAFAHSDYEATGGWFRVAARVAAGHPSGAPLAAGQAVRIFTGALMPAGADTVAMQEDCEPHRQDGEDFVAVPPGLKHGANCRKAGEDLPEGAVVVPHGATLRPQEVAAIASTGRDRVAVFERLKVAVMSTGDELVRPGHPLGSGQVYDSNHYLLRALLDTVGAEVTDLGLVPDRAEAVLATLSAAAGRHHAVLTTGGASRGEEDHLVTSLDALGKRHLWQLAVKPGRPMSFGQVGDCVVLALPGNPVAAFVCFLLYARPTLAALGGGAFTAPPRFLVPAGFELSGKKEGRREFLRGILAEGPDGRLLVRRFPRDGSGLITSLREADGLIELDEDTVAVEPGTPVPFIPFSAFGIRG
ncbi:molybdopterin molybdotransferase MoeA [Faunimonas sp. B44]|uniref:molybdopterin molybdotransferase MoeA n=1 Tax=Faunimonas sp. B44 TaxID=3461493 RepID=UPI0040445996